MLFNELDFCNSQRFSASDSVLKRFKSLIVHTFCRLPGYPRIPPRMIDCSCCFLQLSVCRAQNAPTQCSGIIISAQKGLKVRPHAHCDCFPLIRLNRQMTSGCLTLNAEWSMEYLLWSFTNCFALFNPTDVCLQIMSICC